MGGAVISRTSIKNFIDIGDASAPIGSPSWCRASHVELCAVKRRTDHEVRLLKYGLLEFRQKERWRQLYDNDNKPFRSWEDYVQYPEPNGLGMATENVKAVLEEINDEALLGDVLGKQGRPKKGEEKASNRRIKYGDNPEYILARLDKERLNELAAKVRSGKISAHAAAIEAKLFTKRSPFDQLKKLITKLLPALSDDECEKLRQMLE